MIQPLMETSWIKFVMGHKKGAKIHSFNRAFINVNGIQNKDMSKLNIPRFVRNMLISRNEDRKPHVITIISSILP